MARPCDFGKAAGKVFRLDDITSADFTRIEHLEASVTLRNGEVFQARDNEALELAFQVRPSVVEGKRLVFAKRAWMLHNLVGHPLMQLLAFIGAYRKAIWVHETTTPRAIGAKPRKST